MLKTLLESEALPVMFQPIVDLARGSLHGYEVLGRAPSGGMFAGCGPAELVERAHREGCLLDLDRAWRRSAIEQIALHALPEHTLFFLNVDTRALVAGMGGWTRALIEEHGLSPRRFVIEVAERDPNLASPDLARALARHADEGFRIALDDLGAGHASLCAMLRLRPDVVKLDRELVSGIADDAMRRSLVRALATFARESGIQVVAEGIETLDELVALREQGITLGQGYFLGRPGPLGALRTAQKQAPRAVA